MAVDEVTPAIFEFIQQAETRNANIRWVLFVRHTQVDLSAYNKKNCIFFQGVVEGSWGPRLLRYLRQGSDQHRRAQRRAIKGGVRAKESEYAKEKRTNARSYGHLENVSAHGAGMRFEGTMPFQVGDTIEVAFRDAEGSARTFHGRICWKVEDAEGGCEVGLKFLAAA